MYQHSHIVQCDKPHFRMQKTCMETPIAHNVTVYSGPTSPHMYYVINPTFA